MSSTRTVNVKSALILLPALAFAVGLAVGGNVRGGDHLDAHVVVLGFLTVVALLCGVSLTMTLTKVLQWLFPQPPAAGAQVAVAHPAQHPAPAVPPGLTVPGLTVTVPGVMVPLPPDPMLVLAVYPNRAVDAVGEELRVNGGPFGLVGWKITIYLNTERMSPQDARLVLHEYAENVVGDYDTTPAWPV